MASSRPLVATKQRETTLRDINVFNLDLRVSAPIAGRLAAYLPPTRTRVARGA